ncbi:MAG: imidazole glycerol phosphate synthase subunit HisH [Nitrospirae bacterium]|nr:imidazole glycerol phosphate synthase subunit HisH [Nitrospirota bacterium]MBI3593882.1 imidazole glycerol phosphate synthase subunit HisH [Nitrospirota bacterium]
MIAVIDYGMGNLRSVQNALLKVGHRSLITSDQKELLEATHLVLPGVGAFSECMDHLRATGLIPTITKCIREGKPFLGICLGLQLLFSRSEEFGMHEGLNFIPGEVKRFPVSGLKVPHIGWNQVRINSDSPFFKGIPQDSYFYFDHSYYVLPEKESVVASRSDYGISFVSSVWQDKLFACQFHPEKSQALGLKLLENFGNMK